MQVLCNVEQAWALSLYLWNANNTSGCSFLSGSVGGFHELGQSEMQKLPSQVLFSLVATFMVLLLAQGDVEWGFIGLGGGGRRCQIVYLYGCCWSLIFTCQLHKDRNSLSAASSGWCLGPFTNIINYQYCINIITELYNWHIIGYRLCKIISMI